MALLFCSKDKRKIQTTTFNTGKTDSFQWKEYTFYYFTQTSEFQAHFNHFTWIPLFLQHPFLSALEAAPPKDLIFRYLLVKKEGELVGIYYYQIKKIDLGESMEVHSGGTGWEYFISGIKKKCASMVNFYTLVHGNMLQTGNYGKAIREDNPELNELYVLDYCAKWVIKKLRTEGIKVAGTLIKDVGAFSDFDIEMTKKLGYAPFVVQPDMVMEIPYHWNNVKDYLKDLTSKYRIRAGRAAKKLYGIDKRKLEREDLIIYKDRMHELYKNIAQGASFNLFFLHKDYFLNLSDSLGETFELFGYFLHGKMVGFQTIIYDGHSLYAHFLGYDQKVNLSHHLYHNILLDIIQLAIKNKSATIYFSRTAMEIKSSVGAKPRQYFLYLKSLNPVYNIFTSMALKFLVPVVKWKERHPFGNVST